MAQCQNSREVSTFVLSYKRNKVKFWQHFMYSTAVKVIIRRPCSFIMNVLICISILSTENATFYSVSNQFSRDSWTSFQLLLCFLPLVTGFLAIVWILSPAVLMCFAVVCFSFFYVILREVVSVEVFNGVPNHMASPNSPILS